MHGWQEMSLGQLISKSKELDMIGLANDINDVIDRIHQAFNNCKMVYDGYTEGKPSTCLDCIAMQYAIEQGEKYLQELSAYRGEANLLNSWQYNRRVNEDLK